MQCIFCVTLLTVFYTFPAFICLISSIENLIVLINQIVLIRERKSLLLCGVLMMSFAAAFLYLVFLSHLHVVAACRDRVCCFAEQISLSLCV